MPSNTPMTAAQLLALADASVMGRCSGCGLWFSLAELRHHYGHPVQVDEDEWEQCGPVVFSAEAEAYRAARAASPVTLEEHLMAEEVRTSREYDRIISSDPLPCYEVCRAAEDRWRHARSQREEHARRLAGEGDAS